MNSHLAIVLLFFLSTAVVDSSPLDDLPRNPSRFESIEKSSSAREVWRQQSSLKKSGVSADPPDCQNKRYSCLDCKTSIVCQPMQDNVFQYFSSVECDGQTPYCDSKSGTCVAEQPDECGISETFICMQQKVKIPASNCRQFHYCDENYTPHLFECAIEGQTFNGPAGRCSPNTECGEYKCSTKGTLAPHSLYPKFFSYCSKDNEVLVLDSCPGTYELNVTSQRCEPVCREEGLQQDLSDCQYYYKCTLNYITELQSFMVKERKMCPTGQGFDPKSFQCVGADTFKCNTTP